MRPAIEVWRDAYAAFTDFYCHTRDKDAAAVIEADRAELVAEIVAELRRVGSMPAQIYADHIEAKFGGRDG